ncbi:MAG: hypothetical protein ACHQJX_13895 [Candidatus Acidiferrales bacterium]
MAAPTRTPRNSWIEEGLSPHLSSFGFFICSLFASLTAQGSNARFEYLQANLSRVPIRIEPGTHLLEWVNVVAKVPEGVAELLHVKLQVPDLARYIIELRKRPFLKVLYFTCLIFRAIWRLVELLWIRACKA